MNLPIEYIPGQERVKRTLVNIIQTEVIPQAIIFTGIDGVGKDNAAIEFAKSIIIQQDYANLDKALHLIENLQEPYLKFVFPLPRGKSETDSSSPTEKLNQNEMEILREQIEIKAKNHFHKIIIPKANLIKINSIRDIKKFLSTDYDELGYRFIIISDAHLMNEEAQNALLKSLEEPPKQLIFILTTSQVQKLRPTILSRCWKINFDPLSSNVLIEILTRHFDIAKKIAEEVAPFSLGSINTALNLIQIGISELKEKTISILRFSFGRKYNSAFDEINKVIADQNSINFHVLVGMIITWLNDIQKHKLNINRYSFVDYHDTLEKFNKKFPNINLSDISNRLDKLSSVKNSNINQTILSANLVFELSSIALKN